MAAPTLESRIQCVIPRRAEAQVAAQKYLVHRTTVVDMIRIRQLDIRLLLLLLHPMDGPLPKDLTQPRGDDREPGRAEPATRSASQTKQREPAAAPTQGTAAAVTGSE